MPRDVSQRTSVFALIGCCACLTLSPAPTLSAQSATARLDGVVHDSSDAALPGALVLLTNLDTGIAREMRTDSDGSFQVLTVSPGRYQLVASFSGFASASEILELTIGERRTVWLRLTIGKQSQSVDVIPTERPLIEPSKTTLDRTITPREIDELPVPTALSQDFTALAVLSPGVMTDSAGTGISAAGQTGNNNTFSIDGMSVDSPLAGGAWVNIPIGAAQEYLIVAHHFGPEFGQASGAVVNVLTRSGTNTPTARLYYFQQNGAWNATSATARLVAAKDPGFTNEIVGGFWGGPVAPSRAFLFVTADTVERDSVYVNTSPVATLFRPGDANTRPIATRAPKAFARADLRLSSSNVLTSRANYQLNAANDNQREAESALQRGRSLYSPISGFAVFDTQTLKSSAVNEARLQIGQNHFETDVDRFCSGCATLNYPDIKLGKPSNAPQYFLGDRLEAADVLTWHGPWGRARHTMKVGVDVDVVGQSGVNPSNTTGTYTFSSNLPFDPTIAGSYPSKFTQNLGDPHFSVRETIVTVFGQDDWQPNRKVSGSFGVRWDHTEWPGASDPHDDVAPRVGVTYDPWDRGLTAFRAAFGRYYDESQLPIARDAETAFVQLTITNPGYQGDLRKFDPYAASQRPGAQTVKLSRNGSTAMETPYTDQFSVGVQRELGHGLAVTADAVRALGSHLPVAGDLNYPNRIDSTVQQIIVTRTIAQSWYTGLEMGLRQRPTHRLTYSVAYTWSASQSDTDGRSTFPEDQTNLLADRGPAANDARHRIAASGSAHLPFDCMVSSVITASSALPYNITTGATRDDNHDSVFGNERPPGVGRNSARGSGYFDADVRLAKTVQLSGRRLELAIEAFNITNHDNWSDYSGVQGTLKFGLPTNAGPPRQLQVGARFDF